MRIIFSAIFILLIAALLLCHRKASRSPKAIGKAVALLLVSLLPPLMGNLLIIASTDQTLSTIGYYIYFLGLDLVMFAVLRFAFDYCAIPREKRRYLHFAYIPLGLDVLQYMLQPFTHHAFTTEPIVAYNAAYYKLIPYLGQTYHRFVDYGILAAVIVIFVVKLIRSPRINSEKYSVILATMIVTAVWETAYIFSGTPIDRAMVGFGVFGLLVYYFSLYYRPLRLLDSMLAHMASELPDALFFFDGSGQCIWANRPGITLTGISGDDYEAASARLRDLFGDFEQGESAQHTVRMGDATRNFVLERQAVKDDRQRLIGSFLSVRDNTEENELLQREIYKATHDSLTSLYNRAGYDLLLSRMDLKSACLLLIDADGFKGVNDTYGHETGDKMLQKIANAIKRHFRTEDYVCRIGGDEFVVLLTNTEEKQEERIVSRLEGINAALQDTSDGLPAVTVSVGIARGEGLTDPEKLFTHADRAMYETKREGKQGYRFYHDRP